MKRWVGMNLSFLRLRQVHGIVCLVVISAACSVLGQGEKGHGAASGGRSPESGNAYDKNRGSGAAAKKEETDLILEVLIERVYGAVGDESELSIKINNSKNVPLCVMNTRLDHRMGQTLAVEVRDLNGRLRGDLLGCARGSSREPLYDEDWVIVESRSKIVSSKIPFKFGMIPNTFYSEKNPLPPGDYTLTAVAKRRIMTLPPWRDDDRLRTVKGLPFLQSKPIFEERRKMACDFPADPDGEFVRSKPVTITILKNDR